MRDQERKNKSNWNGTKRVNQRKQISPQKLGHQNRHSHRDSNCNRNQKLPNRIQSKCTVILIANIREKFYNSAKLGNYDCTHQRLLSSSVSLLVIPIKEHVISWINSNNKYSKSSIETQCMKSDIRESKGIIHFEMRNDWHEESEP